MQAFAADSVAFTITRLSSSARARRNEGVQGSTIFELTDRSTCRASALFADCYCQQAETHSVFTVQATGTLLRHSHTHCRRRSAASICMFAILPVYPINSDRRTQTPRDMGPTRRSKTPVASLATLGSQIMEGGNLIANRP